MATLDELVAEEAARRKLELGQAASEATGSATATPGPTVDAAAVERAVQVERLKRMIEANQAKYEGPGFIPQLFNHGAIAGLDIPASGLAAGASAALPYLGIDNPYGNDASFSDLYAAGEAAQRDKLAKIRADAIMPTVQEMAGAIIAGRPAATEVTSVPGLAARGAATGGALGAISGAASGEGSWRDRALQGAVSGGIGALTGGALAGAGGLITDRLLAGTGGMEGTSKLGKLITDQGQTGADVADTMRELGPGATPMDVGPNTRQAAQKIQAAGGKGRGIIDPLLRGREAERNVRMPGDVTTAVGPEVQSSAVLDALHQRKEAIGQQYPAAKRAQQGGPADLQSIADDLDAEIATARGGMSGALKKLRRSLDIPGAPGNLEPSAEGLHAIREAADQAIAKAKPGSPLYAKLNGYRKQIDAELKRIAPDIKSLDQQYHQVSNEQRAFEQGQTLFENPRSADSPTEFAGKWNAMSPGEQEHILKGVNRETWRQLGINGNDLVTLQKLIKGEGKWNQQKLATVIGDPKAEALMKAIQREKVFQETYNKVVQGSKTAESSINEQGRGGLTRAIVGPLFKAGAAFLGGGPHAAGGSLWSDISRGVLSAGKGVAEAAADEPALAKALASQDPAAIEHALKVLANRRTRAPQIGTGIERPLTERNQR